MILNYIFRRLLDSRKDKAVPELEFNPGHIIDLPRTDNSKAGNQIIISRTYPGPRRS